MRLSILSSRVVFGTDLSFGFESMKRSAYVRLYSRAVCLFVALANLLFLTLLIILQRKFCDPLFPHWSTKFTENQ